MVLMSMETYEKNLFLANVYGKLEEAKEERKVARRPGRRIPAARQPASLHRAKQADGCSHR